MFCFILKIASEYFQAIKRISHSYFQIKKYSNPSEYVEQRMSVLIFTGYMICRTEDPDWKQLHPLYKRPASLSVIRALLMAPHKPLDTIVLRWSEGFQEAVQLGPHDAEKRQSLGQPYVLSLLFFQSGTEKRKTYCVQMFIMHVDGPK